MAAHSSVVAWKIQWNKEPGRLQSVASQSQTRLKWLDAHPMQLKELGIHDQPRCVVQALVSFSMSSFVCF